MKDKYTKFVLTLIAIGLLWIAANGTINAQAVPDIIDVNIERIGGVRIDSPYVKPISTR